MVGTVAHQSYPATLGFMLSNALLQTSDVDIAQFSGMSVAVGNQHPDARCPAWCRKTLREARSAARRRCTTGYIGKGGLHVDFVTR
jgi:hypothetical protein